MRFKPKKIITQYTCGDCGKEYPTPEAAGECCNAECIYCPLSDLPIDAEIGHGKEFNYGSVFSGSFELVSNNGVTLPTRVYPLPPLVSKMAKEIFDVRYEYGHQAAQREIRSALGIK